MSLLVLAVKYERKNPSAGAVVCETSAMSGYGSPLDASAPAADRWLSAVSVISPSWVLVSLVAALVRPPGQLRVECFAGCYGCSDRARLAARTGHGRAVLAGPAARR